MRHNKGASVQEIFRNSDIEGFTSPNSEHIYDVGIAGKIMY
jgi:hypothetical protein